MIAAAPTPAAEPIAPPLSTRWSVELKPAHPDRPQIKNAIVNLLKFILTTVFPLL
jgi:hypothetical protein